MQLAEVVSKLTPIITIIILGQVLKKTGLITEEGGIFIKKIIINVGLPSVMFLSFMRMEITPLFFLFEAAFFTLVISPPPFIIPMFVLEDSEKEAGNINTALTVYTIISLMLFTVFFSIHPVL